MIEKNQFSKKQWKIITDREPHKQIIASAGSGKTRTVIGYTMYQLYHSRTSKKILILTFSRKACGELKARIPPEYRDFVEIRTFHSFCYHYLLEYHPYFQSIEKIKILKETEKLNFIQEIIRHKPEITLGVPYIFIMKNLDKMKTLLPNLYLYVQSELNEFKKKNQFLEFDDLIHILLEGLKNHELWTTPLKEKYDFIIVDEFQDTDPEQLDFLKLVQPKNLLVVGDDWQSIYGFRGVNIRSFIHFKKNFIRTKLFRLDENYRSLKSIVELSNHIINFASEKIKKNVKCIRGKGVNIPVLSVLYEEPDFYETIVEFIKKYEVMLLVRSNNRKYFWESQGVNPQSLMTIHKSKGLEFPVVFLDIIEGWSGESFLTDEEIRVTYVAITRAQNLCVVFHDIEKSPNMEKFLFTRIFFKNTKKIPYKELYFYLEKEKAFRKIA